jgi:hypothetical protein
VGLKENVIIGKLIPAGSGAPANIAARREAERRAAAEALAGGELPEGFGAVANPFLGDLADGDGAAEAMLGAPTPASEANPFLADLGDDAGDDEDQDDFNPLLDGDA